MFRGIQVNVPVFYSLFGSVHPDEALPAKPTDAIDGLEKISTHRSFPFPAPNAMPIVIRA